MLYESDEKSGKRGYSKKKLLRVTFSDGSVICYKNATMTFVEAVRKIGSDKVAELHMGWRHKELCSKTPIPGYEQYMKPLDNGWSINTQGDSSEKFLLLKSIITKLNIDCSVEIGDDFQTSNVKGFIRERKRTGGLLIQFADGEYIGGDSPKDSYIQAITKIGLDTIFYKGFEDHGQELVTRFNKYKGQVQMGDKWITIPGQTKDKIQALERINQKLKLNMRISIID